MITWVILFILLLPCLWLFFGIFGFSPLIGIHPSSILFWFVLLYVIYFISFLVTIPTPFLQVPYLASVYLELPAGTSFGRGLRFAMSHKGMFLKLGLIYGGAMVIAGLISVVGTFISLFAPSFLYTALHIYCLENDLVPANMRPWPQVGHSHGPQAGRPRTWRYG